MRDLTQQEVNIVSGGAVSGESQGGLVGGYIGYIATGGNPLGGLIGGYIGSWLGGSGAVTGGKDIRLKYVVQ